MDLVNLHKIAIMFDRGNDRGDRGRVFLPLSLFYAYALYSDRMTEVTEDFSQFVRYDIIIIYTLSIWRNHKYTPVTSVTSVNADFVPKIALFLTEGYFFSLCQRRLPSVTQAWSTK